ncbi:hypothetical protein HNP99_003544 [Flavobacterium sp. 28A]|uniref:hypothetical protein n=1 Tax=Flavobacterium sp. 28A TaxID=2735895 RepID=UPI001570A539|nr:hypothetical protein [Flavobacterium sp. 28A]NRT17165.1 hypothetical protein [Flavobacterium sp. 28A]
MKKLLFLTLLLISNVSFSQNEIKTVNRPDGVTLKYFNPVPVAIANSHEAGLSLYKNINTKQYFLTVTVLFKQKSPTELSGNLLIQTTGTKGLSLAPVWHKLIDMNGRNVATSMYVLTNRDITELKTRPIKLISFNAYDQPVGLNLTKNKDLLIKELSKL